MLQMETNPHKLVDPLFTPFREAGNNRTYYINLSTWDIQRHPGWFDLPRGGILYVVSPFISPTELNFDQVRADGHRQNFDVPCSYHIHSTSADTPTR